MKHFILRFVGEGPVAWRSFGVIKMKKYIYLSIKVLRKKAQDNLFISSQNI